MSRPSPNTALQRTRSAPLRSPLSFETLGALRFRAILLVAILAVALGDVGVMTANMPIIPTPIPPEARLILYDMAAGTVGAATVDTVVQALLAHDFGNFDAAAYMGLAVRESLLSETLVRSILKSYGCDREAIRASFACRFTLESFESGMSFGLPADPEAPECVGKGMDLFTGDMFVRFRAAVEHGYGAPGVVALVRSIPAETLETVRRGPEHGITINGLWDTNPVLFCTIAAWQEAASPPNRWQAVLMYRLCLAR